MPLKPSLRYRDPLLPTLSFSAGPAGFPSRGIGTSFRYRDPFGSLLPALTIPPPPVPGPPGVRVPRCCYQDPLLPSSTPLLPRFPPPRSLRAPGNPSGTGAPFSSHPRLYDHPQFPIPASPPVPNPIPRTPGFPPSLHALPAPTPGPPLPVPHSLPISSAPRC